MVDTSTLEDLGITPAHAGNSFPNQIHAWTFKDHPRTCGEQSPVLWRHFQQWGSPPHMRGTVSASSVVSYTVRITPAHAGNSRTTFYSYNRYQDHPRTCGEQRVLLSSPFPKFGSPPHMRGTDFLKPDHVGKERITPAHAGNSKREGSVIWDTQDHPRTCGEQY